MDYSKYFIISDLDGTLLNTHHKISDNNVNAINYFLENGGRFSIATGRTLEGAKPFLDQLNLKEKCILTNGAYIYDYYSKKVSSVQFLDNKACKKFLEDIMKMFPDTVVEIITMDRLFFVSDPKNIDIYVSTEGHKVEHVNIDDIMDFDWLKVIINDENPDILDKVALEYKKYGLENIFETFFSHKAYFELLAKNSSKGHKLMEIRKSVGENKIFVGIGDQHNDIYMLKNVDFAVAVANAEDEVKKVSHITTLSNDEDAIHDVVFNILPKYDLN